MMSISRVGVLALISLVFAGRSVVADTIYVDTDSTGPAHDGSSWCDAYLYLQDALAVATAGDEIRVADGVYKPDQGSGQTLGDRDATFQLINGVTITGGYAGCGAPDPNERDITVYETILSGDLAGDDVVVAAQDLLSEPTRVENSDHVLAGIRTNESASIDGFTVVGANGSEGGGMYNENSSPTVSRCTFSGNSANFGGGMNNFESSPTVTDCTFTGNSGRWVGGGMYNWFSNPTVADCAFNYNLAATSFSGNGGGMYNEFSSPEVTNCSFVGNLANGHGGGMHNDRGSGPMVTDCTFTGNSTVNHGGGMSNIDGSDPAVTDCVFSGNSAFGSWSHGGGMYNEDSSPTVADCTFRGNSANNNGGGLYNDYGDSTITDCTFTANEADLGGGMSNIGSQTVANCEFRGNWAIHGGGGMQNGGVVINCLFVGNWTRFAGGGGMENGGGFPQVINCTFIENVGSGGSGGAMVNRSSNLTVTNCIFRDNALPQIDNSSSSPTITYSNVQGGYEGEGNMDVDPLFALGPAGCFYLSRASAGQAIDSPCIDVGSDTVANMGLSRLTTRSDEAADTGIVDMGYHYPVTGLPLVMGDDDHNQLVNLADFAGLQNCLTGSGAADLSPCCRIFDFESDDDVDLDDYAAFEAALSSR